MADSSDGAHAEGASLRYTTGTFDLNEAAASVDRIAALADDEARGRERLQSEIAALRDENTRLREANARLAESHAALSRFADIGRKEYDALRRTAAGRVRALLLHRGQDVRFKQFEKRLDDADLDFEELERINARTVLELNEIYSTRPESQAAELNFETTPATDGKWNAFRINQRQMPDIK